MLGAAEVNVALRRAIKQYGRHNVQVNAKFLRVLSAHTFLDPAKVLEASRFAFLAPLDDTNPVIAPENVKWALPNERDTQTVLHLKAAALNRARRQLDMDPVPHPQRNRAVAGIIRKRRTALSVAKFFFLQRYVYKFQLETPRKITLGDIYKLLETADT